MATIYDVTPLDPPAEIVSLYPFPSPLTSYVVIGNCLNNAGDVAGQVGAAWIQGPGSINTQPSYWAVAWSNTGRIIPLPDSGSLTQSLGLNNAGTVVGSSGDAGGTPQGFACRAGKVPLMLAPILKHSNSRAVAINDAEILVGDWRSSSGQWQAFRYDLTLKVSKLVGPLPSQDSSAAAGINANGQISGTSWSGDFQEVHGFVLDGSTLTDLGPVKNVGDLNDHGIVAASVPVVGGHAAAKVKLGKGAPKVESHPQPGVLWSEGAAINNDNTVVGTFRLTPPASSPRAFVWEDGGPLEDLNGRIPNGSGWFLTEAVDINDRGEILCNGINGGNWQPCVLTPITLSAMLKHPVSQAAIDPLALILSTPVYVKIHTPDPGPVDPIRARDIARLIRSLPANERAATLTRLRRFGALTKLVEKELRKA